MCFKNEKNHPISGKIVFLHKENNNVIKTNFCTDKKPLNDEMNYNEIDVSAKWTYPFGNYN